MEGKRSCPRSTIDPLFQRGGLSARRARLPCKIVQPLHGRSAEDETKNEGVLRKSPKSDSPLVLLCPGNAISIDSAGHNIQQNTNKMPEPVDVVICGSGSAGLAAAVWLARYGIRCKILEQREGPMKFGQADGIQCRTIEIFESFSMAEQLLQECFHVLEVAFWGPDASSGGICRIGRTIDTPQGISHMPHAALNQARFNSFLLDAMYRFNKQEVDYGCTVTSVTIDEESVADVEAYPVKVGFVRDGETETINTKYAVVSISTLISNSSHGSTGL